MREDEEMDLAFIAPCPGCALPAGVTFLRIVFPPMSLCPSCIAAEIVEEAA